MEPYIFTLKDIVSLILHFLDYDDTLNFTTTCKTLSIQKPNTINLGLMHYKLNRDKGHKFLLLSKINTHTFMETDMVYLRLIDILVISSICKNKEKGYESIRYLTINCDTGKFSGMEPITDSGGAIPIGATFKSALGPAWNWIMYELKLFPNIIGLTLINIRYDLSVSFGKDDLRKLEYLKIYRKTG